MLLACVSLLILFLEFNQSACMLLFLLSVQKEAKVKVPLLRNQLVAVVMML
jgi:hypothetical protein